MDDYALRASAQGVLARALHRGGTRADLARRVLRMVGRLAERRGHDLGVPIVILGTGRCGTSVFTDLLASHTALVRFPGEANELWHPGRYPPREGRDSDDVFELDAAGFSQASLSEWGRKHGRTIRRTFSGYRAVARPSRRLVIKSAMISFMIPTIARLFPRARFLHVVRCGPPTVASYVVKNWGRVSRLQYSKEAYRMACSRYWRDCISEIDRAARDEGLLAAGRFHELSYEELCDNAEGVLTRVARFLEIDPLGYPSRVPDLRNANEKVGSWRESPLWIEPLDVMRPVMEDKGYL